MDPRFDSAKAATNQGGAAMTAGQHYDVDAIATINEYLDRSDWRVNANAHQGY